MASLKMDALPEEVILEGLKTLLRQQLTDALMPVAKEIVSAAIDGAVKELEVNLTRMISSADMTQLIKVSVEKKNL